MIVLVINTGSSSIKYRLYRMPESKVLVTGMVERIGESRSRLTHVCNGKRHERQVKAADHERAIARDTFGLASRR